jgi:hypothetical protein
MGHRFVSAFRRLRSHMGIAMFARLMRSARCHAVALVLASAAALTACGGSDSGDTKATTTAAAANTKTAKSAPAPAKAAGLGKPIYPRCAISRFGDPQVTPITDSGPMYWRITYQLPASAPRVAGIPIQLTLIEQAPEGSRGKLNGAREVVVAGHSVSLRRARPKTPSNVARWKTAKARYTLLQDGEISNVRRVIACLP